MILGLRPASERRRYKVTLSPLAGRKPRISPDQRLPHHFYSGNTGGGHPVVNLLTVVPGIDIYTSVDTYQQPVTSALTLSLSKLYQIGTPYQRRASQRILLPHSSHARYSFEDCRLMNQNQNQIAFNELRDAGQNGPFIQYRLKVYVLKAWIIHGKNNPWVICKQSYLVLGYPRKIHRPYQCLIFLNPVSVNTVW